MFTMQSDSGMKKSNHANFQNLPDTRYNPNEGSKQESERQKSCDITYSCDLHVHIHKLTGKTE